MEQETDPEFEHSTANGTIPVAVQSVTNGDSSLYCYLLKPLWRVVVFIIGLVLVLAGLVMLVTPGPGLLAIGLGVGLWATEFPWAKAFAKMAKRRAAKMMGKKTDSQGDSSESVDMVQPPNVQQVPVPRQ